MNRIFLSLAVSALMIAPATAQLFIPLGQPVITPRPDIITPQAPTITTKDGFFTGNGTISAPADKAVASDKCQMGVIGQPGVLIQQPNVDANCTALSLASTGSGAYIPPVTTVTANPDIVTPQAPLCSQPGFSIPGGFDSRPC